MNAARRARLHPARGSWVLGQLKGREMVLEIRMEISIEPRGDSDSCESDAPRRAEEAVQPPFDHAEHPFQLEEAPSQFEAEHSVQTPGAFLAAQLDRARVWLAARIRKSLRILQVRSARLARSLPERMRRAALKWPSILLQLGQGLF